MATIKAAVIQMTVSADKQANLAAVEDHLRRLEPEAADLVVLPEMFICPYQADLFPAYAEREGGASWRFLAGLAARHQVYLAAGSVPEQDEENRIYNTAYVFDRQGRQIVKHRKMHLFDVAIAGGQHFKESDTLAPGSQATVFPTEFGPVGLCICYDIRFPELARLMVDRGVRAIVVPGAFNMTTGPAHWELLFRSRALDNQVFLIGAAPARDMSASYTSWGHSIIAGPWGQVLGQLDERPGCLVRELDLAQVDQVRAELPLLAHRRRDLYEVVWRPEQR